MAISITWGTGVIFIPKSFLTFVSGTFYTLDTTVFRLALKALEDDEMGMAFPDTHIHNVAVTVGGITYFPTIEIIAPYSVTFEDGAYSVQLENSNNNIWDIGAGILNQNQVQVIPTNTAGGQVVETGVSGLTPDEGTQLDELHKVHGMKEGEDLVVTPDGRVVGDGAEISQTIEKVGDKVTVSRDP